MIALPDFLRSKKADVPVRDTDLDWSVLSSREPFFGVIAAPEFLRENLDDAAREDFFASGVADVGHYFGEMRRRFAGFDPRSALDFGCGVGRLTRALCDRTGDAVGVDIAEGMLLEARRASRDGLHFVNSMPDRLFDWVVSIIVFQHIPPERGYGLLSQLCERLAPGGGLTLQVPFYRDERAACASGARLTTFGGAGESLPEQAAIGEMLMFDYDLSRVVMIFYEAGIEDVQLERTDHGGFHGAILYGRKRASL